MLAPIRVGIITFPGTNCDNDTYHAFNRFGGVRVEVLSHNQKDSLLQNSLVNLFMYDIIILPGGFSYGDILRSGAIASLSPIMKVLREYAQEKRGLILGICNGFQILCESGLLPGALITNKSTRFICRHQKVQVINTSSPFTQKMTFGQILELPVAHHQGQYLEMDSNYHQAFTYEGSPNGGSCAGILSLDQRILGMMPHPERNARPNFGTGSGNLILESMISFLRREKTSNE